MLRVRTTEGWGRPDGDDLVLDDGRRIPEQSATYLAPVEPTKIIATHLNFGSRVEEYGARTPATPSYFMKPNSSLNGHRGTVARPRGTRYLNYEGEVALVIGRRARGVSEADALDHVGGWSVANDFGLHDFRHADRGSMLRVKGQDGYCPIGPAIADAGDVDPDDLMLRTYVNGREVQRGHTSELLFSYAYLIADLSRLITLEPGDVILTGTPANSRPVEPGDTVEVEVDGIGRLANSVVETEAEVGGPGEMPADTPNARHVALAVPEA